MKAFARAVSRLNIHLLASWLLFASLAVGFAPETHAVPGACKPSPGATRECESPLPGPWTYHNNTCSSSPVRNTEAASLADHIATDHSGSTVCNLVTTPNGWRTTTGTVSTCGGSGTWPTFNFGLEAGNASKYTFNWEHCSTHQPQQQIWHAVIRGRSMPCPSGYTASGTGYCYLDITQGSFDRAKNLGEPEACCGNPINLATGNKFQKEVDYEGSGAFPLRFVRYYNSTMRMANNDGGHYGVGSYATSYGNLAVAGLASADAEPGFNAIGLDLVGANWRHSYQGAIVKVATSQITTAHVYRPDGRVVPFNLHNGVFYPPQDAKERLELQPDNSWRLTTPNNDVETYSEFGRLTSIRNRAGLTQTLSYDGCGRLSTVTDDFGHALTFSYTDGCGAFNLEHRIASITDPAGGTYQYSYDTQGRLASVTYPDSTVREYQYTNATWPRALTGLVDESGTTYASWIYDSLGRANISQHAGGVDTLPTASSGLLQPALGTGSPATRSRTRWAPCARTTSRNSLESTKSRASCSRPHRAAAR